MGRKSQRNRTTLCSPPLSLITVVPMREGTSRLSIGFRVRCVFKGYICRDFLLRSERMERDAPSSILVGDAGGAGDTRVESDHAFSERAMEASLRWQHCSMKARYESCHRIFRKRAIYLLFRAITPPTPLSPANHKARSYLGSSDHTGSASQRADFYRDPIMASSLVSASSGLGTVFVPADTVEKEQVYFLC